MSLNLEKSKSDLKALSSSMGENMEKLRKLQNERAKSMRENMEKLAKFVEDCNKKLNENEKIIAYSKKTENAKTSISQILNNEDMSSDTLVNNVLDFFFQKRVNMENQVTYEKVVSEVETTIEQTINGITLFLEPDMIKNATDENGNVNNDVLIEKKNEILIILETMKSAILNPASEKFKQCDTEYETFKKDMKNIIKDETLTSDQKVNRIKLFVI
jgi:hypothetical protein